MINEWYNIWLLQQNSDPSTGWLQFGAVGLFAFIASSVAYALFKIDQKRSDETLKRVQDENTELKQEVKTLNDEMQKLILEMLRAKNSESNVIDLIEKVKKLS